MLLLHSEGTRAFARLQEELIRTSTDLSLLSRDPYKDNQVRLLFALDCYCFRNRRGDRYNIDKNIKVGSTSIANAGLQVSLFVSRDESMAILGYSH